MKILTNTCQKVATKNSGNVRKSVYNVTLLMQNFGYSSLQRAQILPEGLALLRDDTLPEGIAAAAVANDVTALGTIKSASAVAMGGAELFHLRKYLIGAARGFTGWLSKYCKSVE